MTESFSPDNSYDDWYSPDKAHRLPDYPPAPFDDVDEEPACQWCGLPWTPSHRQYSALVVRTEGRSPDIRAFERSYAAILRRGLHQHRIGSKIELAEYDHLIGDRPPYLITNMQVWKAPDGPLGDRTLNLDQKDIVTPEYTDGDTAAIAQVLAEDPHASIHTYECTYDTHWSGPTVRFRRPAGAPTPQADNTLYVFDLGYEAGTWFFGHSALLAKVHATAQRLEYRCFATFNAVDQQLESLVFDANSAQWRTLRNAYARRRVSINSSEFR